MSKLVVVLFVALAGLALVSAVTPLTDSQYEFIFTKFVATYQKQYHHDAFFTKYRTFRQNFDMIRAHNEDPTQTFTKGINQFADMTAEEFKAYTKGYIPRKRGYSRSLNTFQDAPAAVPTSLDWTTVTGMVTPVKDQGQCGSCWAFSTTGSLEGVHGKKTGTLISLSEQQLVDCSGSYGNAGCNGGLMDSAFEYVIGTGGLCTEASYPYKAVDGTCKTCTRVFTVSSYHDVTANNETALLNAVALNPVSIAIEADQTAFQFYTSGVITSGCGTSLDHGVLAVGYGVSGTTPYWKVKNSWGSSWGMNGYVLIKRDTSGATGPGMCGIAMDASYPVA